jgi:hypothetical protein
MTGGRANNICSCVRNYYESGTSSLLNNSSVPWLPNATLAPSSLIMADVLAALSPVVLAGWQGHHLCHEHQLRNGGYQSQIP